MSTETEVTLTPERQTAAPAGDDSATKPTDEPKPKPSGETEEAPAKSSAETLFDSVMELPEDERNAALSSIEKRFAEKGEVTPWQKRREEELAETNAAASRHADQQQRQSERLAWESEGTAAEQNMDLLVDKFVEASDGRSVDAEGRLDAAPSFDRKTFREERDNFVKARAAVMSQETISAIGQAMNEGLAEHGGNLTEPEIAAIVSAPGMGEKVRVYMAHLATRMKQEVADEMESGIDTRIKEAVANEVGAKKVEENRGAKVEPGKPKGTAAGGLTREDLAEMSALEISKIPVGDLEAAMKS